MHLLFLDCETTGLDPVIHVPWEVAAVRAEHTDDGRLVLGGSYDALLVVSDEQRSVADPIALKIGGFYYRYDGGALCWYGAAARAIDDLCDDRPHLVGAVPSVADRRVGDLMRRCGITPRWHYHLIDIEALIVGYLKGHLSGLADMAGDSARGNMLASRRMPPSWKSDDLSRAIGVDPDQYGRHTAMGDVRWCIAQYAAVFALTIEEQVDAAP